MSFDFQTALKEIQEKSDSVIQIETAYKWGSRAIVCYRIYKKTRDLKWLQRAEDYKHEAIEHASLAEDGFETLKAVAERLKEESNVSE